MFLLSENNSCTTLDHRCLIRTPKLITAWVDTSFHSVFKVTSLGYFRCAHRTVKPVGINREILARRQLVSYNGLSTRCSTCFPPTSDKPPETPTLTTVIDVLSLPAEARSQSYFGCFLANTIFALKRSCSFNYANVSKDVLNLERVAAGISKAVSQDLATSIPGSLSEKILVKKYRKLARDILASMEASLSATFIRFTGWCLFKLLKFLLRALYVSEAQIMELKEKSKDGIPMIYLPLHRSHLDYILMTFMLFVFDIRAPHVAAGDNLAVPVFATMIRWLGGFFIRRRMDRQKGRRDYVYRAVLQSYFVSVLHQNESVEFFVEGGRSRSGKMLPAKAGLLSYAVAALREGALTDAYVVPVSISYEKLMEGSFATQLLGEAKQTESFWHAIKSFIAFARAARGVAWVEFGKPTLLSEYASAMDQVNVSSHMFDPLTSRSRSSSVASMATPGQPVYRSSRRGSVASMDGSIATISSDGSLLDADDRLVVSAIGEHIVYELGQKQPIMSTHLVSFLLLNKHREGVTLDEMCADVDSLAALLRQRGVPVHLDNMCSTRASVRNAVSLLGPSSVLLRFDEESHSLKLWTTISLPPVLDLAYYSDVVVAKFLLDAVIARAALTLSHQPRDAYDQGGSFSRRAVLERAYQICDLLQLEFIFCSPCQCLVTKLNETFDHFVKTTMFFQSSTIAFAEEARAAVSASDDQMADDDDSLHFSPLDEDLFKLSPDARSMTMITLLYHILAPWIDCYIFVASSLPRLESMIQGIEETVLVNKLLKMVKDHVDETENCKREAVNIESIRNAISLFCKRQVLVRQRSLVALDDAYSHHCCVMDDFVHMLSDFRIASSSS